MTFKQFLLNEADEHTRLDEPKSLSELKTILDRDCKPFMKEIGGDWDESFLIRGMKSPSESSGIIKLRVRKDRRPLNTSLPAHNLFNRMFQKEYKVEKIRSQSLFTTGKKTEAGEYGDLYIIFPIGSYTYWWSPDVQDLYIGATDASTLSEWKDYFKEVINSYRNNHLKDAIESSNEIMLLCDEYYAVSWELMYDLKEEIKERRSPKRR